MSKEQYSKSAEGLLVLLGNNLINGTGSLITIDVLHKGGSIFTEKGSTNQVRVKNIAEDHKDKYDDAINAMKKMSGLINYQITLIILKAAKLQKNPHRIQYE